MDFLLSMFSHWQNVLAVVLVFGGLIFFHELGHFSMARILGMGVRTFSLGFGPKLLSIRRGKTDYCLSLVPLGGYVALAGEEDDEKEDDTGTPLSPNIRGNGKNDKNGRNGKEIEGVWFESHELFSEHAAWRRLLVVLSGPVANILLALLIYWGVAWTQGQTYLLPEIGKVVAESPAAKAGILAGDQILSINGVTITDWKQVPGTIDAGGGSPLTVVLSRDGSERTVTLTPEAKTRTSIFGEEIPAWIIGVVASEKTGFIPLDGATAFQAGAEKTWQMVTLTCQSFAKLVQRVVPLDNVGGPILIAQMLGQQAEHGLSAVLLLAGLISINLGILNLLPIPVLDGGHIVFLTLEMIMGRPVNDTMRAASARVGLAMLLGLMLLATWNDLVRLFS